MISLISHTIAGSIGGGSFTTSAIDTTGANFLILAVAGLPISSSADGISDNKSNSWSGITQQNHPSGLGLRILRATGATIVGSGHTFTVDGSVWTFSSLAVSAWANVYNVSDPLNKQNGTTTGVDGTSLQPGSITPDEDNELIIAAVTANSFITSYSIDGGFTISDQQEISGFNHFSIGLAYLIQTSLAASNPTWSWTGTQGACASQASFKAAAATATAKQLAALGVG